MAEVVVAEEAAKEEFDRWADAMDLKVKLEDKTLDSESKSALSANTRVIVAAIMYGHLSVNDDGLFVYKPKTGNRDPITFDEPSGADMLAIDQVGKSGTKEVAKGYAVLAAMTHQNAGRFAGMKHRDLSVCEAIQILFLAK